MCCRGEAKRCRVGGRRSVFAMSGVRLEVTAAALAAISEG